MDDCGGQPLTTLQGPWRMLFKVHRYDSMGSYASAASFLTDATGSEGDSVSNKADLYDTGSRYRSEKLDDWGTISAVRLSMWENDVEVAYFVFSAAGKTKYTWMDCNNLLYSSYTDILSETITTCTISNSGRNFIIQRGYGGCDNDNGWFVVKDTDATDGCDWDPDYSYVTLLYAPGTTYTVWGDSKSNADAFTISVMDWYMVFKGIQGVTPSAGSLQESWEGETAENDGVSAARTLTTSPSSHYKNGVSEIWDDDFTLIETAKYAMYNKGGENAAVIFRAMGSTKNSWFSKSNILYSDYTDLTTASPLYCSIAGDTIRQFALTDAHGIGCTSDYHWMLVMDAGVISKPCECDQDVTTRPYFLYSSGTTSVAPDLGWFPVMKAVYGNSVTGSTIYNFWSTSSTSYNVNEFETSAYSLQSNTPNYRSRIVSSWTSYYISAVRVSFIKSGSEVAYAVFDAHASSRTDWMSCSNRLLYTSYSDVNRYTTTQYCSIAGESSSRRFFAEKSYGGCNADQGWWVVVDSAGTCDWEKAYTTPYVLFSDAGASEYNTNQQLADIFLISVTYDDFCALISCENGGTCYERGVRFECICDGDYYGILCSDLDGDWSDWSSWGSCSTTCHYQGTHSRSRSCNNPSKAGSGIDCSGDTSETQACDPANEVCPLYQSGTQSGDTSYTMSCPTTFQIYTQSAYYGRYSYSSSCHDTSSLSRVQSNCDDRETCTFTFGEGLFTGYNSIDCLNCYQSNPCLASHIEGYVTWKCGRDGGVSTWTAWSLCTATCDGGTRTRSRTCDNPEPISPGTGCSDTLTDSKDCFTVACPSCGEHVSGFLRMEPWNMTSYNDSESGVAYLLTNTHYEIICCESIAAIEFHTTHEGSITFSMWRPSGGSYSVVASVAYTVTAEEVNTTVNYTFGLGDRMIAHIGDMLGWYTAGDNMIPYILCTGEENCPNATKKAPFASEPIAASTFAWGSDGTVTTFPDRAYAIKFYTNPNTVPYVNQTEMDTFVKDHEPPGTWAIDYSIFTDELGDPLTHSMSHPENYFELNSTFDPVRLFLQVKRTLPKEYNVYSIVMTSTDTCGESVSTTYSITTYNAPPVYLNLPTNMELKEDMAGAQLLYQIDVMDPSNNDSICCTLAQVSPASSNFEMKFTNNSYNIFTTASLVFNYKEISDFYKLRVCCSDETGTSMSFIDIDIIDVIIEETYIPPAWFFNAVVFSIIPMSITLFVACGILFATMFFNPELRYVIIYDD
ncbi:uncharacterized protein LOC117314609 [Pecten maximus]|uniref:uncharacterized protein LOC117314609 n=1 Tax=Pecten maximus TaxID=6579 RepID=UPI001458F8FF|nr:uncharacterized protein LOC117314609 [Pecten maximus]